MRLPCRMRYAVFFEWYFSVLCYAARFMRHIRLMRSHALRLRRSASPPAWLIAAPLDARQRHFFKEVSCLLDVAPLPAAPRRYDDAARGDMLPILPPARSHVANAEER